MKENTSKKEKNNINELELKIPNHLAIILDGNGRWAKKQNKPRVFGHLNGVKNLKEIVKKSFELGVNVLSVYAFSTENFNRDKEEVDFLMNLFMKEFQNYIDNFEKYDIRIIFSGRKEPLDTKILEAMKELEEKTKERKYIFNICINYGGRAEIVDATKKIIELGIDKESITEETFKNYLYNKLPDVDFVIRTSGEQRLSNFLLYQISYSELYFTNTYWPDFNYDELIISLKDYTLRDRRFGKIKK